MPTIRILGPQLNRRAACIKTLLFQRINDRWVNLSSNKFFSLDRALILPPVFDSDKFETLSVQLVITFQ
jgi:hypothetical protein